MASDKQSALREERKAYCSSRLQLLTPLWDDNLGCLNKDGDVR
ncbi:unnamed protein product [Tetraodon nigroviridis]|uniref:(spotted green pufferfish) hypothetical protein n=1 Tax=Tetraodon nigroviridis TaxID=99883 RepID=Q4SLZ2_TETNG|nr:unnamed protein product [Tetraodon nigroviridis]